MKKTATVVAIAGLILAIIIPVHAQGNDGEILNQQVIELYRTGKYDLAVIVAKKALEVVEKNAEPYHPDAARSLNNLTVLYSIQGQYAQAEPLYKRSLAIPREGPSGPDHSRGGHDPEQPRRTCTEAQDQYALPPSRSTSAR